MSVLLTSLGYPSSGEGHLRKLIALASSRGRTLPTPDGEYVLWSPGAGIELWIHSGAGGIVRVAPHLFAGGSLRVSLARRLPAAGAEHLEGSFHAWANPEEGSETGEFPLVFSAPDFRLHDERVLPGVARVQIAAFPMELTVYDDEASYFAAQVSEVKFAVESFIPSGLFAAAGDESATPTPHAILSGRVVGTEERTNPDTERPFRWARIRTLGGEVDLAVAPSQLERPLDPGCIVRGSFWLSGRILPERGRPWWRRLLG